MFVYSEYIQKGIVGLLVFLISFLFVSNHAIAQCVTDEHSNLKGDGWLSCSVLSNPNPTRGVGHWIQYDFGQLYSLSDSKVWNSNEFGQTDRGFRNVVIDYSDDGINWTQWGTMEFARASGANNYTGFVGPDLTGVTAQFVLITALSNWGDFSCSGLAEVKFNLAPTNFLLVQAKVFLEGAYSSGEMSTTLNNNSVLLSMQPYGTAPHNFSQLVFANSIGPDIVDWVLVEIRDANNENLAFLSDVGFVDKDGNLVDVDGTIGIKFNGLTIGTPYQIIIRHRNHLDIASNTSFVLPLLQPLDFTEGANVRGGITQLSNLGNGRHGMKAGDFDGNGVITVGDFNFYSNQTSLINQYVNSDCNLDGNVTVADFNKYLPNSSSIGVSLVRY